MGEHRGDSHVEGFISELETLPWFSEIGKPLPPDAGVVRLTSWEEWPGPPDPAVEEFGVRQQALCDAILADAGEERDALLALWDRIHRVVLRVAAPRVPCDPQQDCYHAPTQAVWSAVWTAGLVCWCLQTDRPLPDELGAAWNWFRAGRWPAGFASLGPGRTPGFLIL